MLVNKDDYKRVLTLFLLIFQPSLFSKTLNGD